MASLAQNPYIVVPALVAFYGFLAVWGVGYIVATVIDAARPAEPAVAPVLRMPRSRARLSMPDYGELLHIGGRTVMRLCTPKGHVHHLALIGEGLDGRPSLPLCRRRWALSRATHRQLSGRCRRTCRSCNARLVFA